MNYQQTQPQQGFNQMTQAPQQPNQISASLDQESLEIFSKVYPELQNAFINIAIKAYAQDPMFSLYFLNKAIVSPEEQQQIQQAQTNLTQQTTPAGPNARGNQPQNQGSSPVISLGDGW